MHRSQPITTKEPTERTEPTAEQGFRGTRGTWSAFSLSGCARACFDRVIAGIAALVRSESQALRLPKSNRCPARSTPLHGAWSWATRLRRSTCWSRCRTASRRPRPHATRRASSLVGLVAVGRGPALEATLSASPLSRCQDVDEDGQAEHDADGGARQRDAIVLDEPYSSGPREPRDSRPASSSGARHVAKHPVQAVHFEAPEDARLARLIEASGVPRGVRNALTT